MIKEKLYLLLDEIVTDKDFETSQEKLIEVSYNSILSLHFVSAIEDYFDVDIDNDDINAQFFSDFDYLEKLIGDYIKTK